MTQPDQHRTRVTCTSVSWSDAQRFGGNGVVYDQDAQVSDLPGERLIRQPADATMCARS